MKHKLILMLLILSIGFTSCITERKCNTRYPTKTIEKEVTVYRDTTIFVHDTLYMVADTIKVTDTVLVDKLTGLVTSNKVYTESEYAIAWAQVSNSKLFLELIQKDTAIARLIEASVEIKETNTVTIEYVNKWINHWYHDITLFISIIVILAVLIYVLYRISKGYLKTVKPF